MKRQASALLIAACMLAPAATAQAPDRDGGPRGMLRHDSNQDGQLTRLEFTTALSQQFERIDPNGDGVSTPNEREGVRAAQRDAAVAARFTELDSDQNGAISQEELGAPPERTDRSVADHPRRGPRAGLGMRMPGRLDQDEDISLAAFTDRGVTRFEALDTNKDDVLSQVELQSGKGRKRP